MELDVTANIEFVSWIKWIVDWLYHCTTNENE